MSIQRCCEPAHLTERAFEPQAELLKAVADAHRLRILATLAEDGGHVCVCDFTAGLGLNQSTVSHHLKILKDAELVTCERRGTWVYYRLAPDAKSKLGDALAGLFEGQVTA